jgi:hypothetical protein
MRQFILIVSFFLIVDVSFGQDLDYLEDTTYIEKMKGPVTFDGLSDEPFWEHAYKMKFTTFRPVWGGDPSEKTEMLLTYDDECFYIAGRCYTKDSSSLVIRNLVRDGWRGDDWMTFHIDNTFDKQNALVFSVYPMGSRYDAAIGNDGVNLGSSAFNQDFNMFWDARSVVNDKGWFFELKIPMYNLRFRKNKQGQVISGISAARIIQNPQEMHIYPAIPQNILDGMSKPSVKRPVILTDIKPRKLLLATPYLTTSANRVIIADAEQKRIVKKEDQAVQSGLDMKVGLNPYLTLDLSLNPDFAQVEADDQLLNLTRFSLFFPEKRQFFQEAAGLFDFTLGGQTQMFYSRRIGINDGQLTPVYGGARLTGKLNAKTDIGFLSMQTAVLKDSDGKIVRESENFTVTRIRRKFYNQQSFLGLMATNRWIENKTNTGIGIDIFFNPSGDHYLVGAVANTFDNNQPLKFGASRLNIKYELRKTDGIFGEIAYVFSGRDFNPMSGFLDRSDFHQLKGNVSWGRFAKNRNNKYQYIVWRFLDFDTYRSSTNHLWESIALASNVRMSKFNGVEISWKATYNYEYLYSPLVFSSSTKVMEGKYHFAQVSFDYLEPRARTFRNLFSVSAGSFFDGQRINFSYNPIWNLGKHWELQGVYSINHLNFARNNETIHIGRLRINYALNLHLSVNYVVQYNSVNRQVFNNFRFRYNFKDGHDLFFVWNENFYTNISTPWGELRPVSGNQNFILKYNITLDLLRKRSGFLKADFM